ncbi:hypothetical protein [Enemella evansiae]|uniref:hypothetical protein n=1 Tax=Enemella evansiae TaxID=2016499 RepID=UPI0015C5A821|nr:hypothetical protein [Enemella evansiae]
MSTFSQLLQPRLPVGMRIPDELERAWQWMEGQGFGERTEHGYFLTPYPGDRQLGIVFSDTETLEGWFEPGTPGQDRLLPIAQAAGDGSMAALWLDESDGLRVVELGSEGEALILAESAIDFLRLIAIGYLELVSYELAGPPEDEESIAAVSDFRAWVEETFEVTVPDEWNDVDESDAFTAWVEARTAEATGAPGVPEPIGPPATAAAAAGPVSVEGEITTLLAALGAPDGDERLRRLVALVADPGADWGPRGAHRSAARLRRSGLELRFGAGVLQTVFIRLEDHPRPDALIHGLRTAADRSTVQTLLGGRPERSGPTFLRYLVEGRYLHLEFDGSDRLRQLTLMISAP